MYTKEKLIRDLGTMGIDPKGTLLVHSSMKSIGPVEGGADTVLDALSEYMRDGLLILPTHTWNWITDECNVFDSVSMPSCVGILPELFRHRPGVIRSLHPTHSVAALGRDAEAYTSGELEARSPAPRGGCWGKLYDRHAQILFLGCSLKRNTFLHGVEEWNDIPNRLTEQLKPVWVIDPQGETYFVPQHRHATKEDFDVSEQYDRMEPVFAAEGAIRYGSFGDAKCILGDAVRMADLTTKYLKLDPKLFDPDHCLPLL